MEENFGGKKHGSFHEVIVPDNCKYYEAFAFVRNPYDRAAALYNLLAVPGDGVDLMKLINHEFYKREVEDLEFETFCNWLGNSPEESMIYDASTCQYDHLAASNKFDISPVHMEGNMLDNLNFFLMEKDLPILQELTVENESEHKSFSELSNSTCIQLINDWAHKDFEEYKYEQLVC
jgi:hypothetical protein